MGKVANTGLNTPLRSQLGRKSLSGDAECTRTNKASVDEVLDELGSLDKRCSSVVFQTARRREGPTSRQQGAVNGGSYLS